MAMPWETTTSLRDGLTGTPGQVVEDTGPTLPEIPIDVFCQRVLPHPTILDHLDSILDALEKSPGRWGAYDRKTKRWRAIPDDPREESTVFAKLNVIADAIAVVARHFDGGQRATTRFDQDPMRGPETDWRTPGVEPDGYFVLTRPHARGTRAHWMDVAATGEYKRVDQQTRHLEDVCSFRTTLSSQTLIICHTSATQDSKKIIYNMSHTLQKDPRRRFVFGFTIDDCKMRIWYGSRADIFVSTAFDMMTVRATFIFHDELTELLYPGPQIPCSVLPFALLCRGLRARMGPHD